MLRSLSILGLCLTFSAAAAFADSTPKPHPTAMGHAMMGGSMKKTTKKSDAMKGTAMKDTAMKGDAMHGNAMKGDSMHGNAMKGDAMHGDAMKGDAMKKPAPASTP